MDETTARATTARRRATRGRRFGAGVAVLALALGLVAAACGGDSSSSSTATTTPVAVDYSQPGPYPVGRTILDLGDRKVYVFYPADKGSLAGAQHLTGYSSGIAFPESLRAAVPKELIQDIPIDAYADAKPATDGPFPVIMHSHGFGGYAAYASRHFQHMASWGFVTVSPEFVERDLAASALNKVVRGGDVDVLRRTASFMKEQNASGPLAGTMNFDELAAEGHSAGGSAVFRYAYDPEVKTVIGQAPGAPVDVPTDAADRTAALATALAAQAPPDKPSMILAGEVDQTIPLPGVTQVFDWLKPPKRLAVLKGAGHNAFTDLCTPIRAQGGLMQYSGKLPAPDQLLRLGEDGCLPTNLDPEQGYELINHLTVAQLRNVFGIDAAQAQASLEQSYLDQEFPGTLARYTYTP